MKVTNTTEKETPAPKTAATATKTAPAAKTVTGQPPVQFLKLEHIYKTTDLPTRPLNKEFVAELVASISKNGLDTPLIVWGGEKPDMTMKTKAGVLPMAFLIAGNHRLSALRQIQAEDAAAFAKKFPNGIPVIRRICEKAEALCIQLRENVERTDMPFDQVLPVVRSLIETYGMKQKEIALRVGKSPTWVSMILDINKELGEEGAEEVAKGNVSIRDARTAAKEIKADKKAGKAVDVKAKLAEVKEKTSKKRKGNKERAEKRLSLKALYERFLSLTKLSIGRKAQLLEDIILYSLGTTDAYPDELNTDSEEDGADEKE